MKSAGYIICSAFIMLLCFLFFGCEKEQAKLPNFNSFRDIPGVTEEEIKDIETLIKNKEFFTYGMVQSIEAFETINGEIRGYSALLCEWLTQIFGIPFKPVIYEWSNLISGLETGEIDFTGDLTYSDERGKNYFMTSAIAQRNLKYFKIVGNASLSEIAAKNPLHFVTLEGSITYDKIVSSGAYDEFELITALKIEEIYDLLKSGKAHAFIDENVLEAAFDVYDDVISDDFYPLIYSSVSMSAQNSELKSIISVVQKALQNGSMQHLNDLYNIGKQDYQKHKLYKWFSEEEKAYIKNNPVVRLVAEFDNYPKSFYNIYEKKWQGIVFDLLRKIEELSELRFEVINNERTDWHIILKMLEDGQASMISDLIFSKERKGRFLWAEKANLVDNYALISKSSHRNINVNEILYVKIGVSKGTAHAELLRNWFPEHMNVVEYENTNVALNALKNSDVDMIMSTQSKLLALTNYEEIVGYKTNIVFDYTFESAFGFNKHEDILHSIINKTLKLIDTKAISGQWTRKTYDYRMKVIEARIPWLIGAVILFFLLLLSLILFYKKSRDGQRLEELVQKRTIKLNEYQNKLEVALEAANTANHAKSDFLSKISHEIRTPMNAILCISEIQLQDETLPPKIIEGLSTIYISADSLLRIINDLLDLSKIEAGKLEIIPARYEIASLINDTVQLNMTRIESKPIQFKLKVDENIPSEFIGDELRIKQILNNILSNAFKYTDSGDVLMSISLERDKSENSDDILIIFCISDTGQGMTEEQVCKMFEEYSRFNLNANRRIEGTGLGMNITQNLIIMMNGKITVKSELGKGSVFTVRLPQKDAGAGILGKELAENLMQLRISSFSQAKKIRVIRDSMPYGKVLVVDDVESNLYVAKQLLIPYDLYIEVASSGFEAIDKIKEGKIYDIIFMDHMMPKMDGIETTKLIRSLNYTQPIIALTANAVTGQSELFFHDGFDEFISKPIDIRKLNDVLNKFIRDKQTPETIENVLKQKEKVMNTAQKKSKADIKLLSFFAGDAKKALPIFESTLKNIVNLSDDELRLFTINAHAMKSAFANIGEEILSQIASVLEKAGREHDKEIISAKTQELINELKFIVTKIETEAKIKYSDKDEDPVYLQEQLKIITDACMSYDKRTANLALKNLKEMSWTRETVNVLDKISEYILHSNFEAINEIVESFFNSKERV